MPIAWILFIINSTCTFLGTSPLCPTTRNTVLCGVKSQMFVTHEPTLSNFYACVVVLTVCHWAHLPTQVSLSSLNVFLGGDIPMLCRQPVRDFEPEPITRCVICVVLHIVRMHMYAIVAHAHCMDAFKVNSKIRGHAHCWPSTGKTDLCGTK